MNYKSYPDYKNSSLNWIYSIPKGWKICRLKESY